MRYREPNFKELGAVEIEAPAGTLYWFKKDGDPVDIGVTICAIITHEASTDKPWVIIRSPARGYLRIPEEYREDGIELREKKVVAEIDVVIGTII